MTDTTDTFRGLVESRARLNTDSTLNRCSLTCRVLVHQCVLVCTAERLFFLSEAPQAGYYNALFSELVQKAVMQSSQTKNCAREKPLMLPGPQMCPVALHFVSQESRSASASLNCLLSSLELLQQQPGNTNNCLCAGGL